MKGQKILSLLQIKNLYFLGILLAFTGCLTPSTPTPRPDLPKKVTNPPTQKGDPKKEVPPSEKFLFNLEGDLKGTSITPTFRWKFPKEWRVEKILFNLYRTEEYEKGGAPELIVFDLKEESLLEFKKKHSHLQYYGRGVESLRLLPKTTYTAVLVLQGQPASLVKKIEFVTAKD